MSMIDCLLTAGMVGMTVGRTYCHPDERHMFLLCYIAATFVASAMVMEEGGSGLSTDPFRTFLTGFIGSMAATCVPFMIARGAGSFWGDAAFVAGGIVSAIVIAMYLMSPMLVDRSVRRMKEERAVREAEIQRIRDLDPVVFAERWTPDLRQGVIDAMDRMRRFMDRTSDTYDQNAIDMRALIAHAPQIVKLAGEAIARQDEAFRPFTAREAVDRILAIGRSVDKATLVLRTPEDDALEARLRYVDQQVDDRFSAIA
jgi:hypothetical protein